MIIGYDVSVNLLLCDLIKLQCKYNNIIEI